MRWMGRFARPGKTEPRYSRTGSFSRRQVWEASQAEHGDRWQYSFPVLAAWDIPGLPWASDVAPTAYRALGLIENRGGVVEVGDKERAAILELSISEVALTFQPAATRRAAIRRYLGYAKQ